MIVEVISYVNPIQSNVAHNKEVTLNVGSVEVGSFMNPLYSTASASTNVKKELVDVVSFVEDLYSSATISRKQTIDVPSSISAISSDINYYRQSQKIEQVTLSSFINPIYCEISTVRKKIPVTYHAYTWYIENPSNSYHINNPSYCGVIS